MYGFNRFDVGKLTITQMNNYLRQVPYVLEWSDKFGKSSEDEEDLGMVEEMVRDALR